MYRVLLVEDAEEVQNLISTVLGGEFDVTAATTLEEGVKEVERASFDFVFIDVGLPDGSGFELFPIVNNLKNRSEMQVIVVTAADSVDDKVRGYNLGADDYIVKPIEPAVFRAKIASLVEKQSQLKAANRWIQKGIIRVNHASQEAELVVEGNEKTIDLTPIEFRLLVTFLENEDTILTRDQLVEMAWKGMTHVTHRVVDVHISGLRKKMGPAGSYIGTVYGSGYRFNSSADKI